jgi:predicted enzyme related to lactoylglutathione lyase
MTTSPEKTSASIERLSALVIYSPDPARLAKFYREVLGIPIEGAEHGDLGQHFEAFYKGTQYAIWPTDRTHEQLQHAVIVPSFRVRSMSDALRQCTANQVMPLHEPMDIGEGKTITTLQDPDGKLFRLIEIKND